MKNNQYALIAKNGNQGLDIFLLIHGKKHYITTRRRNGLLYTKLKGGVTLGELMRVKPGRAKSELKYFHYAQYLLKLARNYINWELPA